MPLFYPEYSSMKHFLSAPLVLSLALAPFCIAAGSPQAPDADDVVWTTPSKAPTDSMPLAGRNLALNVWVQDGDLLILVGGPDALDEKGMQVKLGLIRVRFDKPVFEKDFRQVLHVATGEMEVSGRTADGKALTITLRCDAKKTIAYVEVRSETPVGATISHETWASYKATAAKDSLGWMRRLPEVSNRRLTDMKAQKVEEFADKVPDPLSKLTLGGRIDAPGLVPAGESEGKFNGLKTRVCSVKTAAPVTALDLTFTMRMAQDATVADWEKALAADAVSARKNFSTSRTEAVARWDEFWNRSHIDIAPTPGLAPEKDRARLAARNYRLIRYTMASNDAGRAMTLFNGGLFTADGNPDKRNWDGCQFMAQNQMLVYWPMMRAGDFDLLRVGCDFYRDRTEVNRLKAKKLWGVDGVAYNEPFSIFGLDAIGVTPEGRSSPKHLNYHYTSGMVFALMMLGHDSYTGAHTPGYADAAYGIISYYDQYYQKKLAKETGKPLDAAGKLVIYPSDGCEPYHGCTNNTDVLAGLHALVRDLLDTPAGVLTAAQREYVSGFTKRIPDYTFEEKNGRKFYAAASKKPEWIFENGNMDFPQMYICFPFSAVSVGRSDMTLVKNTWDLGPVKASVQHQNQCWYQTAINFARMGETTDAAGYTLAKLLHPGRRFPSFYHTSYGGGHTPDQYQSNASGASFCHTPDMDHGGVAMTALQEMIMQTDGRRILLGVAWPAEWKADFKLHAPYQTVVSGHVADGKVVVDKVTPESRRKDIEIFPLKSVPVPVTPVSAGKPATASSVFGGGYDAGKAFDGNAGTRWASKGGKQAWLEVDLGEASEVSRVVIDEASYPRVSKFALLSKQADGSWKKLAEGDTLGAKKELKFAPEKARVLRLDILDCTEVGPTIDEVSFFAK
jgi:hypothetical protein